MFSAVESPRMVLTNRWTANSLGTIMHTCGERLVKSNDPRAYRMRQVVFPEELGPCTIKLHPLKLG